MSDYFTASINALEAYAAIENDKTIISDKVDGYVKVDKAIAEHGAEFIGNKAELLKRLVDYANSSKATNAYKDKNKPILDGLKDLQEVEKINRRNVRTALLQTIQAQNLVHPLDNDKDNKEAHLPPMLSFEGQTNVFYDKSEVLAYCMEYMPEFITVDWSAFDKVMAKTNGFRDNKGNSILDDPEKPLPPVTIGRVAREVISKDYIEIADNLSEIEFDNADEINDFFVDVFVYFDGDLGNMFGFIDDYLPKYSDDFDVWISCNTLNL